MLEHLLSALRPLRQWTRRSCNCSRNLTLTEGKGEACLQEGDLVGAQRRDLVGAQRPKKRDRKGRETLLELKMGARPDQRVGVIVIQP